MKERWLRLDGREVRVLEAGAGPTIVLVHGLGLSAGLWRPHIDRLAEAGYHVVAPDLPGFGRSDGSATGLSVRAAALWLDRLSAALELPRATWVGHSIAAQQIVRLAALDPEHRTSPPPAALILAAPTGRAGRHGLQQFLGLLTTAFRERPRVVAGVIQRYLLAPLTTMFTWVRALAHDMALDATRVGCPVLIVEGEHDPVVRESFVDRLIRLFPDARATVIEGAAHAVALNPVQPFVDVVAGFAPRDYRSGSSTLRWKSSGISSKSHGSSGP